MIGMVGNHLLANMNRSDHVQNTSNAAAPRSYVSNFQTKRDKKLGLYGNKPSPKININKVS